MLYQVIENGEIVESYAMPDHDDAHHITTAKRDTASGVAGLDTNGLVINTDGDVHEIRDKWTLRASAADNNWYSVTWSPELRLFVAVAYSGTGNRVMSSPDGITWTSRTSAADNDWRSITWSPELSLFIAVANTGCGNRVMSMRSSSLVQREIQSIIPISGNLTLSGKQSTVLVDASGGAITVTLPAAGSNIGKIYNIKKTDASGNAVTIDGNAAETIDGAATQTIAVQWDSYTIHSNGTGWFII